MKDECNILYALADSVLSGSGVNMPGGKEWFTHSKSVPDRKK